MQADAIPAGAYPDPRLPGLTRALDPAIRSLLLELTQRLAPHIRRE
jgi:hypothetical protein